jgi:hypothetical protein
LSQSDHGPPYNTSGGQISFQSGYLRASYAFQ